MCSLAGVCVTGRWLLPYEYEQNDSPSSQYPVDSNAEIQ
jgi:hypothetical protein